jgi:hypothetical protein
MRFEGVRLGAGPDGATVPALALAPSDDGTLPYRLPCSSRPARSVLGCLFFTLFCNAVAVPPLAFVIAGRLGANWAKPGPPWPFQIVIALFALGGLACIVFFIYFAIAELLVAIAIGPTTVELSHHPLHPGAPIEVVLAQKTRRTIKMNSVRLLCVCEEQATKRDGNDVKTETRRVYEEEVFAREQFELRPNMPFEAKTDLHIPPGAMHSFLAPHNQVRWRLVVRGDVAGWPNFEREFPIVVHPSAGAAT